MGARNKKLITFLFSFMILALLCLVIGKPRLPEQRPYSVLVDSRGQCLGQNRRGKIGRAICCPDLVAKISKGKLLCIKRQRHSSSVLLSKPKTLKITKVDDHRTDPEKPSVLLAWKISRKQAEKRSQRFEIFRRINVNRTQSKTRQLKQSTKQNLSLSPAAKIELDWTLVGTVIVRHLKKGKFELPYSITTLSDHRIINNSGILSEIEFVDKLGKIEGFTQAIDYRVRALKTNLAVTFDSGVIPLDGISSSPEEPADETEDESQNSEGDLTIASSPSPSSSPSHKECGSNNAGERDTCKTVSGEGGDDCSSADDCNHDECKDNGTDRSTCEEVTGQGDDECSSGDDCNHKECTDQGTDWDSCEEVSGQGEDQCSSGDDCNHKECIDQGTDWDYCDSVQGEGDDQCSTSEDCNDSPSPSPSSSSSRSGRRASLGKMPASFPQFLNTLGEAEAPITIELFQDVKCGLCRKWFFRELPQLVKNEVAKGRVKFIFRDFPLGMKEGELPLYIAARCSGKQGKYYEYLTELYGDLDSSTEKLPVYAKSVGLNQELFSSCLQDPLIRENLQADVEKGKNAKVRGTPTILVNDKVFVGNYPYSDLVAHIQEELKKVAL